MLADVCAMFEGYALVGSRREIPWSASSRDHIAERNTRRTSMNLTKDEGEASLFVQRRAVSSGSVRALGRETLGAGGRAESREAGGLVGGAGGIRVGAAEVEGIRGVIIGRGAIEADAVIVGVSARKSP
ncbi:hypothetical protein JOM56_004595 [Amanita muscaria]